MESTLYKNTTLKASGVLNGPVTLVYGLVGIVLILINKYIISKIKLGIILKVIISFIIYAIALTLVELLCGYLCNLIFDIDMWNYTNKKYNIGKYICLQLALIWGFLGVLFINIFKPFTDKILSKITNKEVYLFSTLFLVDLSLVLVTKL